MTRTKNKKRLAAQPARPESPFIDSPEAQSYRVPAFMIALKDSLVELIRRTSAKIPDDVQAAILRALENEKKGTIAENALKIIEKNIELAKRKSQPICQDTGSIIFYVDCPVAFDQITFEENARVAVKQATKKGYLRQNSVDSLTGVNDGTNVGPGSPIVVDRHLLFRRGWSVPGWGWPFKAKRGRIVPCQVPGRRLGAGGRPPSSPQRWPQPPAGPLRGSPRLETEGAPAFAGVVHRRADAPPRARRHCSTGSAGPEPQPGVL